MTKKVRKMSKTLLKKMLRAKYLKARVELPAQFVQQASAKICEKLVGTALFKQAKNILFYCPVKNEVNCLLAIEKAFELSRKVFLPRIRGWDFEIVEVKSLDALDKLKKGELGIPEPTGKKTPLGKIDLVVVPGVAFDRQGHRIGYGGGYYDELLKKRKNGKPTAIGLCYAKLLLNKIPFEGHDEQADYIVSESKVIGCKKKNMVLQKSNAKNLLERYLQTAMETTAGL